MSSQPPFEPSPPANDVLPMDAVTHTMKERSILFHYKSENPIELGKLRVILSKPWPTAEVHLMTLNSNTFMAIFPTFVEKAKVIFDQPWMVNGVLLSLESWPSGDPFFTFPVTSSVTWVQIHGLKQEHSNRSTAWSISSLFPAFQGHELVPPHGINRFGSIRLKVAIDNSKPLIPGCTFSFNHSEPYLLKFKFEKFSSICYDCGFIGHSNCGKVHGGDNAISYGEWMHGDTPLSDYANAEPCSHSSTWADMMKRQSQLMRGKLSGTNKENRTSLCPSQEMDIIKIGRKELQNLLKGHTYHDPVLGWTLDEGFPEVDDIVLQFVFGYTFSSHESHLIKSWENATNIWTWSNSRLNQVRKTFERISQSLEAGINSSSHQSTMHPTTFPNINVVDHLSDSEASSSSSSSSGYSLKAGIGI